MVQAADFAKTLQLTVLSPFHADGMGYPHHRPEPSGYAVLRLL